MAQATQSPIRKPDLAEYTDGRLSAGQKVAQAEAEKDVYDSWNNLLQLEKIVEVERKEIEHDKASLFEASRVKSEFNMGDQIDFASASEVNTPLAEVESSFGQEAILPQEHPEMARVDLRAETQHHDDLDFKYFFDTTGGWAKEGAQTASKFILKHTLNVKTWGEAKGAIWDKLIWTDVFGFGQKKEQTPEEKAAQQKKNTNFRIFYDALRAGMRGLVSTEQRRALRSRIQSINKSLGRGNLSYEGILDASGQIREDVQIDADSANSQKSLEQLQAEKKQKLMMATPKAKKGPGITTSMDKSHNFNNAAKLAG